MWEGNHTSHLCRWCNVLHVVYHIMFDVIIGNVIIASIATALTAFLQLTSYKAIYFRRIWSFLNPMTSKYWIIKMSFYPERKTFLRYRQPGAPNSFCPNKIPCRNAIHLVSVKNSGVFCWNANTIRLEALDNFQSYLEPLYNDFESPENRCENYNMLHRFMFPFVVRSFFILRKSVIHIGARPGVE